jgi:nucleoside-diphosphate-sugar epimerase
MTTLITGGTGLIGTTLADQLLSAGERVVLAAAVGCVVPGARVTITSNGEPELGGLVTRVSDRALEEAVGYKRRPSPLDAGVRFHANAARARAGLPPLGG